MLPWAAQLVSPRLPRGLRLLPNPLPAALSGRLATPLPRAWILGTQRAYHVPPA